MPGALVSALRLRSAKNDATTAAASTSARSRTPLGLGIRNATKLGQDARPASRTLVEAPQIVFFIRRVDAIVVKREADRAANPCPGESGTTRRWELMRRSRLWPALCPIPLRARGLRLERRARRYRSRWPASPLHARRRPAHRPAGGVRRSGAIPQNPAGSCPGTRRKDSLAVACAGITVLVPGPP